MIIMFSLILLPALQIFQRSITLRDMDGVISNTYMFSVILAIILIGLAVLFSSLVKYNLANPKSDRTKRKTLFWATGSTVPVIYYLFLRFFVVPKISVGPALDEFLLHSAIAPIVGFATYVVLGVVISKIFRTKKIGNWFNKAA